MDNTGLSLKQGSVERKVEMEVFSREIKSTSAFQGVLHSVLLFSPLVFRNAPYMAKLDQVAPVYHPADHWWV